MSILQDLQCGQELIAEIVRPVVTQRKRGQRTDDVETAGIGAERRLDPPQRQNNPTIDLILRLDRLKRLRPRRGPLPCSFDTLWRRNPVDVTPIARLNSGCRRVAASTRSSGIKPAKAASNVARLTPRAAASGQSLSRKACNGVGSAFGWAIAGDAIKMDAADRRKARR